MPADAQPPPGLAVPHAPPEPRPRDAQHGHQPGGPRPLGELRDALARGTSAFSPGRTAPASRVPDEALPGATVPRTVRGQAVKRARPNVTACGFANERTPSG